MHKSNSGEGIIFENQQSSQSSETVQETREIWVVRIVAFIADGISNHGQNHH
jgi:hypothetical protein